MKLNPHKIQTRNARVNRHLDAITPIFDVNLAWVTIQISCRRSALPKSRSNLQELARFSVFVDSKVLTLVLTQDFGEMHVSFSVSVNTELKTDSKHYLELSPNFEIAYMTTLITGGTGFVGQELVKRLDDVTITSRNRERALGKFTSDHSPDHSRSPQVIQWSPTNEVIKIPESMNVDAVVNLMGESVAEGRWTDQKKKRIRESRIQGTRNLVDGLVDSGKLPKVFVSASAIGIYGNPGEDIVEEDHAHGEGFLTEVCQQWEAEALKLEQHGTRVVCLRIGIVLGGQGGALEKMVPIFKFGLGGKLGNGKQWMAWIHVDDLVSMIQWSLENESVSGPINGTAPNPVRNSEFTKALAKTLGRPAFLPAPRFGLRLAFGEFADSLFWSQRIVPAAALNHGFQFQFPELTEALKDILSAA